MFLQFCSYGGISKDAQASSNSLRKLSSILEEIDFCADSVILGKQTQSGISEKKVGLKNLSDHLDGLQFLSIYDTSYHKTDRSFSQKISVYFNEKRVEAHFIIREELDELDSTRAQKFFKYWHRHNSFYGFARMEAKKNPELYPFGLSDPLDDMHDMNLNTIWMVDQRDRQSYLTETVRDIFPRNFLPRSHLDLEIVQGQTLSSWIADRSDRGHLEKFTENVSVWVVDPEVLFRIRESLKHSHILVHNRYSV